MGLDEKDVLDRLKAGDDQAFNLVMDAYQDRLFRLALRLMRNREDAEEVLQEALLKAFFGISKFRGESTLYTWLYSITLKIALKRRRRSASLEQFTTLVEDMDPASRDPSPDSESASREIGRLIDQAVVNLPRAQRAVFVLRHQEEMTFHEIAQHLGKSEGGIKALYFHAVRKLRRMLEGVRGVAPRS